MHRYCVMIEGEYGTTWPLWDCAEDDHEPVDVDNLALPVTLAAELRAWARDYASPGLEPSVTDGSKFAAWVERGRELASSVQRALGTSFDVLYFNEATGAIEPVRDLQE